MRAIGYKLTHDTGFAPNPFHGFLTLATCKPAIRRCRAKGDWVAGFASAELVRSAAARGVSVKRDGLVFLADITEPPVPLGEYFVGSRFQCKKPRSVSGSTSAFGDNLYEQHSDGVWTQPPNPHHDQSHLDHDISGVNALVSSNFYYFGRKAQLPPGGWNQLLGHPFAVPRTAFLPPNFVSEVLNWFERSNLVSGMHGAPALAQIEVENLGSVSAPSTCNR